MTTLRYERKFLIPKRGGVDHIPALSDLTLARMVGEALAQLSPPERHALRDICESGDLLNVDGHLYLLAPVSAETIDALAAFEADLSDMENDLEDEPEEWAVEKITYVAGVPLEDGDADGVYF